MADLTAKQFITRLEELKLQAEAKNTKLGMGQIFSLAKEFIEMPLGEIDKLLSHPLHEMRVGAVSVMDFQARAKKTTPELREELFDLYIKRHDKIDTWDLVDRSAIYVVGQYLADKPRAILYKLAKSKDMAERRTAIVATAYFMLKQKQTDDTFKLAEVLINDSHDLVHKAVGWMLRVAGDIDRSKFIDFLNANYTKMPRVMLRYSIEKLPLEQRKRFMAK